MPSGVLKILPLKSSQGGLPVVSCGVVLYWNRNLPMWVWKFSELDLLSLFFSVIWTTRYAAPFEAR